LRSFIDMLLVMIPLILAGLLTVAGSVLFKVPFNFANVIALPLILGVGVDYGVYIVQNGRSVAGSDVNILRTASARAVLFGALITVANFGNLALSPHPGTRSMGIILSVGLAMTLLCALVLLPGLLALRQRWLDRRAAKAEAANASAASDDEGNPPSDQGAAQ
jgi:predicted RND superfamily exporter protein